MESSVALGTFEESVPRYSEMRRIRRVLLSRKIVIFSLIVLGLLILVAIFAPLLAPYSPSAIDLRNTLSSPTLKHLLGTDQSGRDMLSRLIYGSRTSLMVAAIALGVASTIGMTMGVIAAYFGGVIYAVIMRVIDAVMAFPTILLAIAFDALLGGGLTNTMIAIGLSLTPYYARMMCGQVLTVREMDYVKAGKTIGARDFSVIMRHVVPNCFPTLIVMITMQVGLAILAEAGLSFLGIGVQPPTPTWGAMVRDGYRYLLQNPILSVAPGAVIMIVAFAFNMFGDGLRDALDPRLRGSL